MDDLLEWLHEHGLILALALFLALGLSGHLLALMDANANIAKACLWAAGFGAGVVIGAAIATVAWQSILDSHQRQLRAWYDRRRF